MAICPVHFLVQKIDPAAQTRQVSYSWFCNCWGQSLPAGNLSALVVVRTLSLLLSLGKSSDLYCAMPKFASLPPNSLSAHFFGAWGGQTAIATLQAFYLA